MSDANDGHSQNIQVLTITLNRERNWVEVKGPIHDKTLCANMLADALKVIANQKPKVIIPAGGGNGN